MDQGSTFETNMTITDDITNTAANISGYIVKSQMRRSYYSANASANLVCTIVDAPSGNLKISLDAANTSAIRPGRYLFDVDTTDRGGKVVRILEGIVNVTAGVTR
jgi:hypothetical protein